MPSESAAINRQLAQLESSLAGSIEAEVNVQIELARNAIGIREVGREWINSNLAKMPLIVSGDYEVEYKDKKKVELTKMQSRNHALWVVTLQKTIEDGSMSYSYLASLFHEWVFDTQKIAWPRDKALPTATKFVEAMQDLHILKTTVTRKTIVLESGVEKDVIVAELTEEFKEELQKIASRLKAKVSMVCKPLLFTPLDWTDLTTGVGENANLQLIPHYLKTSKVIAQPVLDAVNKLQRVRYVFDKNIMDIANDKIDNIEVDSEEYRLLTSLCAHENDSVAFPVTLDQRGRMNYRGGLITPQGTDITKAALRFEEKRPIGVSGLDALCIHTANKWKRGKLSFNKRIEFIKHNWAKFMRVREYKNSYDPQAFVAALELQSVQQHIDAGNTAESFESNLVCHQDGTCNGLQHMAALTKNLQTATAVCCTPSTADDAPNDIYSIIAIEAANHCTGDARALVISEGREMAKKPVMITGYGAGEPTLIEHVGLYLIKHKHNPALATDIGKAYVKAMQIKAAAVMQFTNAVKRRVEAALKLGIEQFEWTTMDGFIACTEYRLNETNRIHAGSFNALMREPTRIDIVGSMGGMTPNFIQGTEATHMRMIINACKWPIAAIHDSAGSHAATFFDTAKIIREKFVMLHKHNNMDSLFNNMKARIPNFKGSYEIDSALESKYLFS